MKFKTPIEVQAGISDGDPTNPLGQSGYLLSSDGSNVNWVSPGGLSAETAEAIVQPIKADEALVKGDPVYIVGYQNGQDVNIVAKADSSDVTKMPVVGLADDDYANQAFGTMTAFGSFNGAFDTSGGTENWAVGDIIFVKPGGGLTNIKPGGTDLIQNVAIVSRVQQNTGELEVIALGRTNDVPNLPEGRLFVGTATNTSLTSDVIYVDDTNDRVGIGTTNPTALLTLESSSFNPYPGIDIKSTNTYAGSKIRFLDSSGSEVSTIESWSNPSISYLKLNYGAITAFSSTLTLDDGFLYLSTAGSERMRITSSGNVGIGTTNPDSKLEVASTDSNTYVHIRSDSTGSTRLKMSNSTDTNSDGFQIINNGLNGQVNLLNYKATTLALWTNSSQRVAINSSGNVGIGTPSPSELLHISSLGPARLLIEADTNNVTETDNAQIILKQDGGAVVGNLGYKTDTNGIEITNQYAATDGILTFGTSGTERMRVKYTGEVGIGTTDPRTKLHVANGTLRTWTPTPGTSAIFESTVSNRNFVTLTAANEAELWFGNAATQAKGRVRYDMAGNDMEFWTNATQKMVIDGSGDVGIGTTNLTSISSTSRTLSLGSTSTTTSGGIAFQANSVVKAYNYVANNYLINQTVSGIGQIFYGAGSEQMRIHNTTGNVGIGTIAPNAKLEVAGSTRITGSGLDVGYGNNGTNYVQVGFGRTTNGFALIDLIGDSTYTDYGFRILRNSGGPNTDTDILHRGTGDLDLKTIDAGDIGFHTASARRMIVKSSGNVGIGDSNPDAKLEVAGHSTSGKFLLIDSVAPADTFLDVEDGLGSTLLSITRETGNTIKFNSFNDFSFTDNISVTGTVTATNFILSSDETLKDNIKEIDVKHVDVNWKNFELKSEPGIKRAGVIAQELEVKHPEFVRTAGDGLKSVAYIDLLITKIAELEARLEKAGL